MKRIPNYIWTFAALFSGITLGGLFPENLQFVANGTAAFIRLIVMTVPVLILAALSPAVAKLVKRGLAGKFAGYIILWYVFSSTMAGFIGLVVSAQIFNIPFSLNNEGALSEAIRMFAAFKEQTGASLPLLAILFAILIGIVSIWIPPLFRFLEKIEKSVAGMGKKMGLVLTPVIFCFGISIGVRFGAMIGMEHYLTMTLYTVLQCAAWWLFYIGFIIKYISKRPIGKLLSEYFIPTGVFAAGTCSSLATLPVNLANVKKYGVRDEVADFIVPFGAVANMDASALMYVAYAPFVMTYVFDIQLSWTVMIIAWPAVVLFTIAAPGLPAGMGTALWSATLFASMTGLEEPLRTTFITTWIALSGGIPDMARTATNCTGDGLTAVLFDSYFEKFSTKKQI